MAKYTKMSDIERVTGKSAMDVLLAFDELVEIDDPIFAGCFDDLDAAFMVEKWQRREFMISHGETGFLEYLINHWTR